MSRITFHDWSAGPDPRFWVAWNSMNEPCNRWRIEVYCSVCDSRGYTSEKMRGGCMMCYRLKDRLNAVVHTEEWRRLRRELVKDKGIAGAVADWLEEHELHEAAEIVREKAAQLIGDVT